MHKLGFVLFFLLLVSPDWVFAAPLGTVPTIEERDLKLIFDFRSDLWTSPYTYKSAPVRITAGEFRIPVAKAETWKASADVYDESLNLGRSDFTLGKKKVFIGSSLRSQSVGFGANNDFESGSSLTVFGAFASASDEPHRDQRDEWIEANVIYRSQLFDNHRWIFVVNQSNNRGFRNGFPFPYFGVIYEPDPEFRVVAGFPFAMVTWGRPETWKKGFTLTPFGTRFDLETNLEDKFVFNAFAAFTVRSYLHAAREDSEDRLYYQEFALEASVRTAMTSETGIIFGLGYAFDRRLYESETIYSPNSEVTIINNDFYGRVAMEFRL